MYERSFLQETAGDGDLVARLQELCAAWEARETLSAQHIRAAQEIFMLAMRLYLAVVARRVDHEVPPPLPAKVAFGATECLIVANELLKYAEVDVFELGLFRQYGVY
jgi:aminoglycoside phosphotransferase (APT) family kinase protein